MERTFYQRLGPKGFEDVVSNLYSPKHVEIREEGELILRSILSHSRLPEEILSNYPLPGTYTAIFVPHPNQVISAVENRLQDSH